MSVLATIEQLLARQADLRREADEIDRELERVRLALQGGRPTPARHTTRNFRRDIRVAGSVPNHIYAALAVREPQTIKDLAAHLKKSPQATSTYCTNMVQRGQLSRVHLHTNGRTYVYARTADAFALAPEPIGSGDDDELGHAHGTATSPSAPATISPDEDTSHV